MGPWLFYFLEAIEPALWLFLFWQFVSCGSCCIQACPYHAIAFNQKIGKIQKCNLCYHRVTNGLYPACADNVCLAHCIYFGEPAEIERKILEKRKIRGGWGEILPKALIDSRG